MTEASRAPALPDPSSTASPALDEVAWSIARGIREATAKLPPEVAQTLWHMDLPWAPIYTDLLYRGVADGAERLGIGRAELYDAVIARAVPPRAARDPDVEERERDERYRLDLFRTVLGWRLQRLVEAPPSWPHRAPLAPLERDSGAPRIAVLVLSCNRLEYLRNTLHAFHRTAEHPNCELIVLDNASTDGSREWLERALQLGLVSRLVLAETNLGNAKGFNVACAHARPDTELFVKLDSDICPLTPGWLGRMLRLVRARPSVGVVGLLQVNHQLLRMAPSAEVAGEAVVPWTTWAVGSCMAISRAAFDRLGFFHEPPGMTYSWDDVDYWMRAVRAGFEGYYLRDVAAAHQTALDASRYRGAAGARNLRLVRALLRQSAREYDTGERSLSVFPDEYRDLGRQDTRRVVWPS